MSPRADRKPLDTEKVLTDYAEGKSLREIAQELGISHVHVSRILQKGGVARRPSTNPSIQQRMREARQKKVELQKQAALLLIKQGMTLPDVVVVLGRKPEWLARILKEEGIYAP